MHEVADIIKNSSETSDGLREVLTQQSAAYGSVSGALDEYAGHIHRGTEHDGSGRKAWGELVNAIHAPRAEAEQLAAELVQLARNVLYRRANTW